MPSHAARGCKYRTQTPLKPLECFQKMHSKRTWIKNQLSPPPSDPTVYRFLCPIFARAPLLILYFLSFPQKEFKACYCSYFSVRDSLQTFALNSARSTLERKRRFQTVHSPVDAKK